VGGNDGNGCNDCTYDVVQTPIDRLVVASDGSAIVGVWMANAEPDEPRWADGVARTRFSTRRADSLSRISTVNFAPRPTLAPNGQFQRRVWAELTKIPFGATISYAQLARRVSNEAAVRAVGAANVATRSRSSCCVTESSAATDR
jgi:methylated-DNA-[protein]-cysteine S-methyltransferase